jgi:hypothetical protein
MNQVNWPQWINPWNALAIVKFQQLKPSMTKQLKSFSHHKS